MRRSSWSAAAARSPTSPRALASRQQTLRNWSKQVDVEAGRREGLSSEDKEELMRLRRRVRVLEQEREILKKAAAFFAKENGTR